MRRNLAAGWLLALIWASSACDQPPEDIVHPDSYHFPNCDIVPVHQLTRSTGTIDYGNWAVWSPDGSRIIFNDTNDLWSIPVEGGAPLRVTSMTGVEFYPDVSPAPGRNEILFTNLTEGQWTIYRLDLEVGEPVAMAAFKNLVIDPSWSASGDKVVFMMEGIDGVFTVPSEGGDSTLIANSYGWDNTKVVAAGASRSGDEVIYLDLKAEAYELNRLPIGGGEPTVIYRFDYGFLFYEFDLDVSPDGSMTACTAGFPIRFRENLFLIPTAGGEPIQLTEIYSNSGPYISRPSWSPDGARIAIIMNHPYAIGVVDLKL